MHTFNIKITFHTEKLSSVLLNIQGMISSIDDSQQTSEIVSTYQLASSTLRSSYAESGINANTLDDVLAEVQEVQINYYKHLTCVFE